MRPIALGRGNWLFARSKPVDEGAAVIMALIVTTSTEASGCPAGLAACYPAIRQQNINGRLTLVLLA